MTENSTPRSTGVPFGEAFRYWLLLGFINFGGPTGQIAMMHRELVDRRRWVSEERFLHALNYCMLLPGPEAQQLAIYVGWLLHGTWGGIVAGAFFVIPSVFIMLALSYIYVVYGSLPAVAALFYGLKPAVIAVVLAAVVRIGGRALRTPFLSAVAAAAFLAMFLLGIAFPAIVAGAALLGLAAHRRRPAWIPVPAQISSPGSSRDAATADDLGRSRGLPTPRRLLAVIGVSCGLWFAPMLLLAIWRGTASVLFQQAVLFSKAAMVTFGGAYAVLAYIRDMAVDHYGWLAPGQMMDGLGLAESTPGPLIMVTQFVAFVGAWHHPDGMSPLCAGILGALVTTWVTFVPCFLWIFLGAPFIERLRGNAHLTASLSAITAAVAGVILHLAVVFANHALFPGAGRLDVFAACLTLAAFAALQSLNCNLPVVIAACALAGMAWRTLAGA